MPAGFQHDGAICGDMGVLEALTAARRTGEPARGVVPGNDRNRVRIEMIGVLVREDHEIDPHVFGRQGR